MADTWFTQQETSKTAPNTIHEKSSSRISPGPYIGIVKNVIDPLYSGVLQVFIPELGGDATDKTSWKNMMYATPFYGRTNIQDGSSYAGSPHSYGMWFVPPDIDNKVLCIFANGDPAKGYWFACIPDWPAMHMLPGLAAPVDKSGVAPVVDHYDSKDNPQGLANVRGLDKYIHEDQRAIWDKQGLTQDPDRGPGRSSAQRETPSAVFGISTPGRPIMNDDPKLYPDNLGFTSGGTTQKAPGQLSGVMGRKGGHTFIMDDGDSTGDNQMFRLRSAAGHMILMNDTKEFIYIINSKGTAWIEMDAKGAINIFSQSQMNITAKDGFSLETQGSLKMKGKTVDIVSETGLNISAADINVLASGTNKISAKQGLHLKGKNTYLTGDDCIQIKSDGHIDADSSCHTINTAGATKAQEASEGKKPENMPSNEPRNKNAASLTSSPTANTKNNAASNPNNPYGATNNFGSSDVPNNVGNQTNNNQPIVYNNGPQGSLQGQGSTAGSYQSSNSNNSGINWTVAGTIAGAVAGIVFGGGSSYNVSGSNDKKLSVGEAQNNPGNLPYNSNDKFAVGYNNNLAVYAKPEAGIAALALAFDALNISSTTRSIDIIQSFLNAKSNTDPKVIDMTRFMHQNLGIVADDYVALHDPNTRIGWVAYAIQYIQGRLIYTYDQTVTGCSMSLGISVTDFLQGIQPLKKPWQNNNGYNPLSGFVNPAQNNNIVQKGNSPLQTIGNALQGGIVGGLIGSFIQGNQRSNQSQVLQFATREEAMAYLNNNPNLPVGTTIKYADGSSFTLGGGSVTFVDNGGNTVTNTQQFGGATNEAQGASVRFDGIISGGTQGNGGCATLAQTYAPNLGQTRTWSGADRMSNGTAQAGDVYITTDPSGKYTGQSGVCHTVIFNNYTYDSNGNINGAYVTEQYVGQPPHTAYYSASRTDKYETFQNFQRAVSDTAPSGANVTQTQQYTNVDALASQKSYAESGSPLPPVRPADSIAPIEADAARDMKASTSSVASYPYYDPTTGKVVNNDPSQSTSYPYYDPTTGTAVNAQPTPDTDFKPDTTDTSYLYNKPPTTTDNSYLYNTTPVATDTTFDRDYAGSVGRQNQPIVIDNTTPTAEQQAGMMGRGATVGDFTYQSSGRQDSTIPNYGPAASNGRQNLPINSDYAGEKNAEEYVKAQAVEANRPELTYDQRTGEVISVESATPSSPKSIGTDNSYLPIEKPAPVTGGGAAPGTGGANGGQVTPQGSSSTGAGGKSC
jgi:hypothetical protein